jgi:hypothetical protein
MNRRAKVVIVAAILIVAGIVAVVVCLVPHKPHVGPWVLSDGSELSLAGVTYGKNHAMRYGDRFVDYLYPILPPTLRRKFGCKVVRTDTVSSNGIVVWFWTKAIPQTGSSPAAGFVLNYKVGVTDLEGGDADAIAHSSSSVVWRSSNVLSGWELKEFPRRSKEFGILIYRTENNSPFPTKIAEFKIPNWNSVSYPLWKARSLPDTVRTNRLEIKLDAFKNERPAASAQFYVSENQHPAVDWTVSHVRAYSATGESRDASVGVKSNGVFVESEKGELSGSALRFVAAFTGTFWQEEPAWNLKVELTRTANFLPEELWTVKGIPIQRNVGTSGVSDITTNIYGSEIALVKVGGRVLTHVGNFAPGFTCRSPLPAVDRHLQVVEVRDEHGKKLKTWRRSSMPSTAGRGATVRELDEEYEFEDADTVKSIDVTLAYTKSLSVEFMAKPTVVGK